MAFSGKGKGKKKSGKTEELIDTKNFFDGSVFTYESDSNTVRFKSSGFRSVYGSLQVDVPSKEIKIVEWTIKIVATQPTTNIMLGICSTPNQFQGSYQTSGGYCLYGNGGQKYHASSCETYAQRFVTGDTIKIILNSKDSSLSFEKNDQNLGVAWPNLPQANYRLSIDLYNASDVVQIVSQNIIYNDRLLQCVEYVNLFSKNLDDVMKLFEDTMKELKTGDPLKNLKAEQGYQKFCQAYSEVESKLKLVEKSTSELSQVIKHKTEVDVTKWRQWKLNDFIMWVYNIKTPNNEYGYRKCAESLGEGMQEESLAPDDFQYISNEDLLRWGVTNFGERRKLLSHIKALTSGQLEGTGNDNHEENEQGTMGVEGEQA